MISRLIGKQEEEKKHESLMGQEKTGVGFGEGGF